MVWDWLKEEDKPAGKFKKKKEKKKLTVQFLCESDKVQLFSFSMRTLLNRIYMYIYKYILKLYKRKKNI